MIGAFDTDDDRWADDDQRWHVPELEPIADDSLLCLIPFETAAIDTLELGADALLYVMAHRHTITVPTDALQLALKVATIAIARQSTAPAVLRDVNDAIDTIAASLRCRLKLDAESAAAAAPAAAPIDRPNAGPMAPLIDSPIVRPPSGAKADVAF